jgi:hypothetical protein
MSTAAASPYSCLCDDCVAWRALRGIERLTPEELKAVPATLPLLPDSEASES